MEAAGTAMHVPLTDSSMTMTSISGTKPYLQKEKTAVVQNYCRFFALLLRKDSK